MKTMHLNIEEALKGMLASVLVFGGVLVSEVQGSEATQKVLAKSLSPDKRTVIVDERDRDGEHDFYFRDEITGRKIGNVLPPDQRDGIRNVSMACCWNRGSSKVAVLVRYGSAEKLSELLLFTRDARGTLQPLKWKQPDVSETYRRRTGQKLLIDRGGHDEDGIGPWLNDTTVALVSGEAAQKNDVGPRGEIEYRHVYVTFRAHLDGTHVEVNRLRLTGILENAAARHFERKWGSRYFQTD